MEVKLKLGFDQLIALIKQLSVSEKRRIAKELQFDLNKKGKNNNDIQKLLLKGPTWSDKEYREFVAKRKQLNQFPAL